MVWQEQSVDGGGRDGGSNLRAQEHGSDAVADQAKSLTRQIDDATAYATRKGWTVSEACIFVDDGISGAEFANRPGFVG